jgi:hypothetical protein
MKRRLQIAAGLAALLLGAAQARPLPALDLTGYAGADGAITILHGGPASDPYFALQALLLARDNGLDATAPAEKFARWLVPRQKPDGTFDRFCRVPGGAWSACKTADADDSLLALWMRLLDTMPGTLAASPQLRKSYQVSKASLEHLYQPSRGIYMVSPVYLHGLFMDNLEVWSHKDHLRPGDRAETARLARAIHETFWDPAARKFLVSTQLEQRGREPAFYPDHVAQVFPLLVGFPLLPSDASKHYNQWMRQYRALWLSQGEADYPWGLLAVLALRQGDVSSARCWLREAGGMRHSARWAVTDEVSLQILSARGLKAAPAGADCT